MNLQCPHNKPVVLQIERGITTYIHAGEVGESAICTVLNSFELRVDQILSYRTNKFALSPEFRAAFLVSALARYKVYSLLVKLNNDKLKKGLLAIDEIVDGTPHADYIWGEMVGIFGNIILSNLTSLTQKNYTYSRVIHVAPDRQLTMRPVDGLTFEEVTLDMEAEIQHRSTGRFSKYSK